MPTTAPVDAPRLLLISHSGRLCSAGSLLLHAARSFAARGFVMDVWFPRESPRDEALHAYFTIGVRPIERPFRRYHLVLANSQASAEALVSTPRDIAPSVILWVHEAWRHRDMDVMRRAVERSSAVIFQTAYQRDCLYADVFSERDIEAYFIPNAIPDDVAGGAGAVPMAERPRVVSVGTVIPRKRHADLSSAVTELREDVECWIVGSAHDENEVSRIRSADGDGRTSLIGHVDNSVARAIISTAAVYVQPSSAESQPLAVLEAMRYARPIVVADLPIYAALHLTHGESCLVYPVGDVHALRDALRYLLHHRNAAETLGRRAFDLYLRYFALDRFQQHIGDLVTQLMDRAALHGMSNGRDASCTNTMR